MRHFDDKSLSWDTIGRFKAKADAWQDSFTKKCSKVYRETGSLGDEALCAESTELENLMYSIMDMEKKLRARENEISAELTKQAQELEAQNQE